MKEKSVLHKGLNDQMKIDQKMPRGEVKGSQKPVQKKETVKSGKGSFKIC